jgi:hypothetical protein
MTGNNPSSQYYPKDEFGNANDQFGCANVSAVGVVESFYTEGIDLEEGISSLPAPERSQFYPKEEFVVPPLGAVNLGR